MMMILKRFFRKWIWYRKNYSKKHVGIVYSISLSLVLGGILSPLIFNTYVYALPPSLLKIRTIGELIVTLFAGAGTAITNPTVVPAIYSNYDTSLYSFESMIDEGVLVPVDPNITIEEAKELLGTGNSNSSPFNLDTDEFRDYLSTNWQKMRDLGIDTVFRLNEIANTDNTYGAIDNLGQIVKNVANYGYLGTNNAIAIVTNPGAVVNVGIENILDSIKSVFGKNIVSGTEIISEDIEGYNIIGFSYTQIQNSKTTYYYTYYCTAPCYVVGYGIYGSSGRNGVVFMPKEYQNNTFYYRIKETKEELQSPVGKDGQPIVDIDNYRVLLGHNYPNFSTRQEAFNYLQGIKDGTITPPEVISPDMVNKEQGNIDDLNNISPSIPSGYGLNIIDSDTYNNYLESANDNFKNGVPSDNAVITDEMINNNLVSIPDEPEYPWSDPTIPGTNPINPNQPVIPEKPTLTPEESNLVLGPTAGGITSVFPFCIPWDIYGIVKELKVPRKAPYFVAVIENPFGEGITIELDMSVYDDAAEVLRICELILFIIGLAIATRSIIGA